MITLAELKIFKLLIEPSSITRIAKLLELSVPAVSRCVSNSLKEPDNGLFEKERIGKKAMVRRADTPHAHVLSSVFEDFVNQPLEHLLSWGNLRVLGIMLEFGKSPGDVARILQITRQHASKCLGELARHGLVVKRGREYRANPHNRLLLTFAKSYFEYKALRTARSLASDSTVLWNRAHEFLFKTRMKVADAELTAVSRFHDYGLPLMSNTNYHFISSRKLTLSDIIVHTVLIDPRSPVYNTYACLLYQKTSPTDLQAVAGMYDMTEHFDALMNYLETHEGRSWLFSWDEYEELARDYGVIA